MRPAKTQETGHHHMGVRIQNVEARAYEIPTDAPEADGTLSWDKTTLVTAEVRGGPKTGFGYSYADACIVPLIEKKLAESIKGLDAFEVTAAFWAMQRAMRNLGRTGLAMMAISAVDLALWDLKAKLLDLPLVSLLGGIRHEIQIYGSGGFTSYHDKQLVEQLGGWVTHDGCRSVKMKVGSQPERDMRRVQVARSAINDAELFVDANGAYTRKQALAFAEKFGEFGVTWFEEPVTSDDLDGLRLLRDGAPAGMDIAAGEYGSTPDYFRRMLAAGAVDVQQADITRCGGISGFLDTAALCQAYQTDLSGHTAPSMHLHAACAAHRFRNLEWFHDHVRIEHMLLDGAPVPKNGTIRPDLSRPGHGLELKRGDAERFAV
jgi:L-alanine-DL-glutamate epimerase-like enolase superfamily enzyme